MGPIAAITNSLMIESVMMTIRSVMIQAGQNQCREIDAEACGG
jgi:hypothetical protein